MTYGRHEVAFLVSEVIYLPWEMSFLPSELTSGR